MLHLHDIESGYGAGQVLFGVSLSVPAGRVVSLMGRNGMGKTTTIAVPAVLWYNFFLDNSISKF